jgi:hypothetical protein
MSNFIEDYLKNPEMAIASAAECSKSLSWADNVDENMIYTEIATGHFALYEVICITE